jgi:hypothetical protein
MSKTVFILTAVAQSIAALPGIIKIGKVFLRNMPTLREKKIYIMYIKTPDYAQTAFK